MGAELCVANVSCVFVEIALDKREPLGKIKVNQLVCVFEKVLLTSPCENDTKAQITTYIF